MSVERPNDRSYDSNSNQKSGNPLRLIPHLILMIDFLGALAMWIFREAIFGVTEDTDMMAMIAAITLVIAGISTFFIVSKIISKRGL